MKCAKLDPTAVIPNRATTGSAGYDLVSIESYELKPGERKPFKTGIALQFPNNIFGRIAPRSGLSVKRGIDVMAGVIDEDYTGEILVVLVNLGQETVTVNAGDKIAQIILQQYFVSNIEEVAELTPTERGSNGFGSTDKNGILRDKYMNSVHVNINRNLK